MRGVLQIEAMAQVASILLMKLAKSASRIVILLVPYEVKFRKPVFPATRFSFTRNLSGAQQSARESTVQLRGKRRRCFQVTRCSRFWINQSAPDRAMMNEFMKVSVFRIQGPESKPAPDVEH